MMTLPSIFVSHGAPMLIHNPGSAHNFLKQLGSELARPNAILCITAHWETERPFVSGTLASDAFHNGRFSPEILQLRYPAPGAPALAAKVADLLAASGLDCEVHPERGLDRGTWIPLMLMYPETTVPVVQLSVQPLQSPRYHLELGRLLEPLRHAGVLILGSGSATHNLMAMTHEPNDEAAPDWVVEFDQWLQAAVINNQVDSLLNYQQLAPHVERNHPTHEHLLPLFVALGAGGETIKPCLIHSSYTYGVLSMAAFAFD